MDLFYARRVDLGAREAGTGVPLAEVMRKYGVKPKTVRRPRKAR